MNQHRNILIEEESDIKKLIELVRRNLGLFFFCIILSFSIAFAYYYFAIPSYQVSASLLIKQDNSPQTSNVNEFINSNLFGTNQNFQNELWVLKSTPVIEQTIDNLNLIVGYYQKEGLFYTDEYKNSPYSVIVLKQHIQPINARFQISIIDNNTYQIKASEKNVDFVRFETNEKVYSKKNWEFETYGKFGELVENEDLAIIIMPDTSNRLYTKNDFIYSFQLATKSSIINNLKTQLEFNIIDKQATVIQIGYKTNSINKGIDIINELMDVYSQQNLDRKNHIAEITIQYIENQLDEISDSLSITEQSLQSFRSASQLLDVTGQTTGITNQYMDLQNQLAELMTRKRYYDYVSDYLATNEDFSNMIVPASMGIQDQLLNNLMSELIQAYTQRSNLIDNRQERNPMVERLTIQIENTRKTITDNIEAIRRTTEISIEEMNRRIRAVESELSRMPETQRLLGGIERQYKLNDAIYNYLLEKRAEAKITQASNLPDNIIVEPANMVGNGPVSPNAPIVFLIALIMGIGLPFGFLFLKSLIGDKIETNEDIEKLTEFPVLGKILHNRKKLSNVMLEYPTSTIAESFRALRTNIDYIFKAKSRKVFLVTSSIEGEGKSFNALNLAMSFAQIGRRTLLIDFDMRKTSTFFSDGAESLIGVSLYLTDKADLHDIVLPSPHEKLDYIQSGPVPPNPVELMAMDKTNELLENVKLQYDCIVIDTPPLAQVSDAYLLIDHADIKIIISRLNFTLKRIFALIMKDLKVKNVENTCVVINDNRIYRDQYGYGYGYNKK